MRIPTLAVTTVAAAALVALPTTANAVPPVAVADSAQAEFETPVTVNVLTNDNTDAGNAGRSLEVVTDPAPDALHGTVSCESEGDCTYTPADDWTGTDTFTYTVSDGTETNTGTVTVKTVKILLITIGSNPANVTYSYAGTPKALVSPVATVSGTVRQSSTVVLEGVQAQLFQSPPVFPRQWTAVGTPKTSDATGLVSTAVTPALTTATVFRWETASKNSAEKTVHVTPALKTAYSSKKQAVGQPFTVSGESAPATGGETVELQRRNASGRWELVQSTTLGSPDSTTGIATYAFPLAITPTNSGAKVYRVVVPAAHGRERVTSGENTIQAYDAAVTNVEPANADEWVKIENTGKVSINLLGWTLSDSNSSVTLPSRSVPSGGIVKVHTGKGASNGRNVYLKRNDVLWAATGSVSLHDNKAVPVLISTHTY